MTDTRTDIRADTVPDIRTDKEPDIRPDTITPLTRANTLPAPTLNAPELSGQMSAPMSARLSGAVADGGVR
ncbi:hypothetical protein [Kineosporia succinea]|uniref:Uncharacterized protein n=1 Tax=Kineosporia succinea TaxID=84632 RepID=A0ABT9P261_9ACTN|nr:hypothetical protein [Kineosporia succinea]MDP9826766.1 hypothetical protein [Kineosporia succinea]